MAKVKHSKIQRLIPILRRIVNLVVDLVHPDRIILFGSRARGDASRNSDIDLLIVAPSKLPKWRRTPKIYEALSGIGIPKDVVWWTPKEVRSWKNVPEHFINTVLREGRVLYEKNP